MPAVACVHAATHGNGRYVKLERQRGYSCGAGRPPLEPSFGALDKPGHKESGRDKDRNQYGNPDADTRNGDERRRLGFTLPELLAQTVNLLTRMRGETLRLVTELAVHADLGLAAARSALRLGGSLTLISLLASLVLVGHATSVADGLSPVRAPSAPVQGLEIARRGHD